MESYEETERELFSMFDYPGGEDILQEHLRTREQELASARLNMRADEIAQRIQTLTSIQAVVEEIMGLLVDLAPDSIYPL